MSRITVGVVALLGVAVLAEGAAAQICAGFPTTDRQFSFGASLGFPEGGDQWGVEASYNAMGPGSFHFGLQSISPEDDGGDDDSLDTFYGGVAFELAGVGGPRISACPVVQIAFTDTDFANYLQFPIGFGIGGSFAATPTVSIMPFAIPQLVITRISYDETLAGLIDDETETDFAISAGALATFGTFFGGVTLERLFEDGADTTFGIRAGIRL